MSDSFRRFGESDEIDPEALESLAARGSTQEKEPEPVRCSTCYDVGSGRNRRYIMVKSGKTEVAVDCPDCGGEE